LPPANGRDGKLTGPCIAFLLLRGVPVSADGGRMATTVGKFSVWTAAIAIAIVLIALLLYGR
jgi:hypothetical protein